MPFVLSIVTTSHKYCTFHVGAVIAFIPMHAADCKLPRVFLQVNVDRDRVTGADCQSHRRFCQDWYLEGSTGGPFKQETPLDLSSRSGHPLEKQHALMFNNFCLF